MNRTSLMLTVAGLITGIGGAVGLQVHAQGIPSGTAPVAQVVEKIVPTDNVTATDTDNIQDPSGKEQLDATESPKVDTDNIQDPGGVEVPDSTNTITDVNEHQDGIDQDQGDKNEKDHDVNEQNEKGNQEVKD